MILTGVYVLLHNEIAIQSVNAANSQEMVKKHPTWLRPGWNIYMCKQCNTDSYDIKKQGGYKWLEVTSKEKCIRQFP